MRLGRRQVDVLRAAKAGTSSAWHEGRGNFAVSGVDDVYGDDVLNRLLELGLICHGEQTISGYKIELTDKGAAVTESIRSRRS